MPTAHSATRTGPRAHRAVALTLTGVVLMMSVASAQTQLPEAAIIEAGQGQLECTVDRGAGFVLGAFRDVTCDFRRARQPIEHYEGYTGVVTSPVNAGQSVVYAVSMPHPAALAELGGTYTVRGFGPSGGSRALEGGRSGQVLLVPTANSATTRLADLNVVLGLDQLHLNYAGATPYRRRR